MANSYDLIHAVPLPVLVVGRSDRVLAANTRAVGLIGSDCTGWHYVTALRQPGLLDVVEQTLADKAARVGRFQASDGARETVWKVSVAPLDSDGAVLLTFEDMTALEDAGQMRRDFVANVSHELRTPLTALLGFIETLRGPARDDAAARERFLSIMEQEARRMHRLVEDLLSLSRVEDSERMRPTGQVDLTVILQGVLRSVEGIAKGRGARVVLDVEERADMPIPGDPDQLRQVFTNLIENALKYGPEGGTVTVSVSGPELRRALQQSGIAVTVKDEGEGIAPHHIARLTERFYRVDTHRSRQIGGTGLGLAIVKHIVNRHRGRLRIESAEGQGSEFTVLLPAPPAVDGVPKALS